MINRHRVRVLALACLIAPRWLAADIVDSAANGFTVKETVNIQAPPQDVYTKIFRVADCRCGFLTTQSTMSALPGSVRGRT